MSNGGELGMDFEPETWVCVKMKLPVSEGVTGKYWVVFELPISARK